MPLIFQETFPSEKTQKDPGVGQARSVISELLKAGVEPIAAQDRDWKTKSKAEKSKNKKQLVRKREKEPCPRKRHNTETLSVANTAVKRKI